MEIYLRHKNHGIHIAYSDEEAAKCEANGWVRDPNYPPKKQDPVIVEEWLTSEPKKRGRPRKAS